MMSIGLVAMARAATTLPVPLPTTAPAVPPTDGSDGPAWLVPAFIIWATIGLIATRGLGAFRRRGIVGPERLDPAVTAWPLLGIAFGGFVALIVGTSLAGGLMSAVIRATHARPSTDVKNLVIGALGEAIAAVTVVVLIWDFWAPGRAGLRLAGLRLRGIPNALAGGAAALFILFPMIQLTGLIVVHLYRRFHLTQAKPHPVLEMMRTDHHAGLAIAAVLTASIVAPVAEELLFRGLIQTMLGRLFNWTADCAVARPPADAPVVSPLRPTARWLAVFVTSIAFAAIHGEPAFLAPIFVLSVGLGFVYERSGNLYMNMVTHSLFNTAQIIMFVVFGT